jgi:hypothetical protein
MKFFPFLFTLFALFSFRVSADAQSGAGKSENIIIVTLDGMRWEEVFGGMDSAILENKKYTRDSASLNLLYGNADRNLRKAKLFPFLWNTVANKGQIYGDRLQGSEVNNANPYKFSYPGYNEIFTGYPDLAVNSNDKILNKNTNVLEFINKQPGYQGKVAVFSTWDCYPYILNQKRSGIYINSDVDSLHFNDPNLKLINEMQFLTSKPVGERPDLLTYFAAKEYLKAYMPKVLYIAFDETDDYAHAGEYDQYLASAHAEDAMIRDIWNFVQSVPGYRNKTTILVTCDHGRGNRIKDQWTDHGKDIEDAGQIWIAVMGPRIKARGLVQTPSVIYQKQLATTIASILGFHFTPDHGEAEPIAEIIK